MMDEITLETKNENRISNVLNQEEFQHLGGAQDDFNKNAETPLGMVRTGSPQKMYQLQSQNNHQHFQQEENLEVTDAAEAGNSG